MFIQESFHLLLSISIVALLRLVFSVTFSLMHSFSYYMLYIFPCTLVHMLSLHTMNTGDPLPGAGCSRWRTSHPGGGHTHRYYGAYENHTHITIPVGLYILLTNFKNNKFICTTRFANVFLFAFLANEINYKNISGKYTEWG